MLNIVLDSLTLISILALVGIGLAVIYGLMGVINLAHGSFVTVGAYTLSVCQLYHLGYWGGLIIAPFMGILLGLLIERFPVRYLYDRPLDTILATWGLNLIIAQTLVLVFGAAPRTVNSPFSGPILIFGDPYPAYRVFLILFAGMLMVAVALILWRTSLGLDIRAVISDAKMAEAVGINTRRVYAIAFASGAALAAIAGVLVAPLVTVIAQMGINYLARAFLVVILGGAGTVSGVIAGSGLVGGIETILGYHIPLNTAQAVVMILAIVVIRIRPEGLITK